MKAVVIKEPGKVSLEHVNIPEPQPGFVRVKVKAAAICATDLEVLDGNIPANYPLTPGHEWSGIVDAVGSEDDAHWIGKRVIGSNDVVCLKCEACRKNHVILEGKAAILLIERGLGCLFGGESYQVYVSENDIQAYEQIEGDILVYGIPGYRASQIFYKNGRRTWFLPLLHRHIQITNITNWNV